MLIRRSIIGEKRIDEIMPLWATVSTHTARKTFISLALEAKVPVQVVMRMSGHNDYRSMKPYIDIRNDHLIEQMKKMRF